MSAPEAVMKAVLEHIQLTRDEMAEGELPPFRMDQAFDDWAADLCAQCLYLCRIMRGEYDGRRSDKETTE